VFLGIRFGQKIHQSTALAGLNPAIRAFVISEALFWSGWNFVAPIFSIFVVKDIPGATVSQAAYAFTVYLLCRMLVELLVSRKVGKLSNPQRAVIDVLGMMIVSLAYLAIAIKPTLAIVFVFYAVAGLGFGISSPVKYSLFSRSLEKETEASVWGLYDVVILLGMAVATALGGLIADWYGFKQLFLLASAVNILGALPYLFFIRWWRSEKYKRQLLAGN
jgi:MFS family permease